MKSKKIISVFLVLALVFTAFSGLGVSASAASATALSKTSLKLIIGESSMLVLKNSGSSVTWSTANSSVATVKNGVVKGIRKGNTTVTAKYGGKNYNCTVTVGEYRIDYSSSKVMVGNRLQLELVGWSGARTWKSSNTSIATVSADGVVRGVNEGKAKITATFGINTLSVTITVSALSFPVTADKVSYIKFSPRTENAAAYALADSYYITDRTKIKSLISYVSKLSYMFMEPGEFTTYKTGSTGRSSAYSSDTLIFYNSSGTELARFESPSDDDDGYSSLNIFRYSVKSYFVKNMSGIINQVFGWLSYDKLVESAKAAVMNTSYKTASYVSKLSYVNTANLPSSIRFSSGGNNYVAKAVCRCTDGTDITVYIDPKTGGSPSESYINDEDIM